MCCDKPNEEEVLTENWNDLNATTGKYMPTIFNSTVLFATTVLYTKCLVHTNSFVLYNKS